MPNTFLYTDWLAMEALRHLTNKLEVSQFFNTSYNSEFKKEFPVGETVRIPYPWRPTVRTGLGYNPQSIERIYTTVTVDQIFGIDFEWDSAEKALEMERGQERISDTYIKPSMNKLAQEIDDRCALYAYQHTSLAVGVQGTNPTSFATFGEARQKLIEQAGWTGTKKGTIITPAVNTSMVNASGTLFNPTDTVSKAFKEGYIGRNAGVDWYESMSLYSHTASTWAGAVTVATTAVDGATTLALTVTNGDTFRKGDIISIAAVKPVNPETRRTYGSALKTFVITSENQTISGTSATISISPALYGPLSQYQNVDALPLANAALTLFPGTNSPNGKVGTSGLLLTTDAFALVGVPMELPTQGAEIAVQKRDPESGIAVRFIRQFDPFQSKMINRFDVLMGFGSLYSDNSAVRILGA
jgi:hypothetical protein